MTIMDLNDFRVYRRAMDVAGTIWSEVAGWHAFERDTLGWQLVQAADSVAANISEGHGRYHFGERRQFCYYARGSIQETLTWVSKARRRGLIDAERYRDLRAELIEARKMLNGYIRSLDRSSGSQAS